MNLVARHRSLRSLRRMGRLVGMLAMMTLLPVVVIADTPIASSSFVGTESPLSENGAWVAVMAYSPYGTMLQKNNGAFPDRLSPLNHAGARTTAAVPTDHYSEIVVGHVASDRNNVGALVRVQTSGPAVESTYLWWASVVNGGNFLYRLDANVPDQSRGISYTATALIPSSPVVDGDRLRLIARGPVIYGIKNGVRDFIYNTGPHTTRYSTGTTGIFAYADGAVTNSVIASWSTGAAPVSSGTWASSSFPGTENPLDEGDRWYPLPGYSGFKKASGLASGRDPAHNATGVWGITAPATQYSEVTLGAVSSGGGGPIVRIDRTNTGQTGWLLFLFADGPSSSGIYKMTPGGGFTAAQLFTPTIVSGDKWRLTATGNVLEVFRNGVSQFMYTTDGSYPTGDVGIETYTPSFSFSAWEGGDPAGGPGGADTQPPTTPSNVTATAASSSQIDLAWTASTDNVGVTAYLVEACEGSGCTNFTQISSVTGTTFSQTGLAGQTSYSYRVRATDAAGNLSTYSNTASATTPAAPDTLAPTAPANLTATAASSSQINLTWTASTDNVGVTSYGVERCQGSGCTAFAPIATVAGTTFSNTGLVEETIYSYRVRATDAAGNLSAYSSTASATTPAAPDTTPPTAPSNLTATAASSSQVNLTWSASTDNVGVTAYRVERCQGSGCTGFAEVATVTGTTYSNAGLAEQTSYSYRVRATDAAGNLSAYSNTASATTPAAPDTTPPTAPANLTATAASTSQVNLTWSASTDNVGVTAYRVERCQGSGCTGFAEVATVTGTTFSNTGLTAQTSYSYRVRATDAAGNLSAYSNTASATTPAPPDTTPPTAPSGLTATAASSSQVNLTWSASTDNVGVTAYRVERCQGSGCTGFAEVATVTGTTFSNTGLTAQTSYSYRVRATDAAGNLSAYSNTASATTLAPPDTSPPTAPTMLPAVAVGQQVALLWTSATDDVGVTGYLLERCQGVGCTSFAQIATVSGTSYTDAGLAANVSYSYRVRATDAAGNRGPYSNTVSATTVGL